MAWVFLKILHNHEKMFIINTPLISINISFDVLINLTLNFYLKTGNTNDPI